MSYSTSSLLPLTILQLVRRTLSQLIESSTSLPKRALPASLADLVPSCTTTCLESFISVNYQPSSCSNELDLTCLCTHTTPSGLTIGEAALQCLVSVCPSKDTVDETSVYNICSGIPNAIAETVGTITITMTSTNFLQVTPSTAAANSMSSTLPSSVLGPSSSIINLSSIVSDTGTPAAQVSTSPTVYTTFITASIQPPFLSSSSNSSAATPSGSSTATSDTQIAAQTTSSLGAVAPIPSHRARWTTGHIVGIVVGGAAVLFAFGVLAFLLCYRRRKQQRRRRTRWSKAIEQPPPRPSTPSPASGYVRTTFANPSDLTVSPGQRYYANQPAEENRRSFWRRSIRPEDIGVAVSPEIAQHDSPDSFSSQRTSSQLLPALPNHALWPAPLRLSRQMPTTQGLTRPESTATVFEEDLSRDMSAHQAVAGLQGLSEIDSRQEMAQRVFAPQIANDSRIDPQAQMYTLERATAPATKSPITLTPVYDNGIHTPVYEKQTSASIIPGSGPAVFSVLPQPHYFSSFGQDPRRAPSPQANLMHQRSLHTYSSAQDLPRHQQQYPRSSVSTPSLSPATNYTDKRSTKARKGSIESASSDVTTFDTGDDTTPEQELDKRLKPSMLSPVMESFAGQPAASSDQGSPIRGLQYPRIPRPAVIAKQAERIPRPRAALQVNTIGSQLQPPRMSITRDQLVQDERSFLQSRSTSQDSPEPSPSLLAKRRGDKAADEMLQGALKLSSDSANRTAPTSRKGQFMHPENQPLQSRRKPKLVLDTKDPVVENEGTSIRNSIGLTPTRRGADLFLTVN